MRRREFLTIMGGAAAWPFAARAQQQPSKVARVGMLWHAANEDEEAPYLGPFRVARFWERSRSKIAVSPSCDSGY
jgi:putative ABC transport system substrate-binding protein